MFIDFSLDFSHLSSSSRTRRLALEAVAHDALEQANVTFFRRFCSFADKNVDSAPQKRSVHSSA